MKHKRWFWNFCLLAAICGCAKPALLPADFSQRISSADRIVVTNRYRAFTSVITGQEAAKIAKAVASSQQGNYPASAIFDWEFHFYTSTNFLGTIHLQDRVFLAAGGEYRDDTGILSGVWKRLERDADVK